MRGTASASPYSPIGPAAAALALSAVAWCLTADRMEGMDAGPGTPLGSLGWFLAGWALMMVAMMLPSLVPVALKQGRVSDDGIVRAPGRYPAICLFVAGFFVSWAAFGLIAYGVLELIRSLDLGFLAWGAAGRYLAGGVIVVAALYELTPPKRACLDRCRRHGLSTNARQESTVGALRAGVANGASCIGCCWALMAALFALGAMSMIWMVVIAALIAVDKLLAATRVATIAVAVTLAILGLSVCLAPERVPGLTVPGSEAAMEAMDGMEEMEAMDEMKMKGEER